VSETDIALDWETVKELTPSIASHGRWQQHEQRGKRWYVLQNQMSGEHARFNRAAHAIVSKLDGSQSLETIHAQVNTRAGGRCTPDIIIDLLIKLQRMGVLLGFHALDTQIVRQRQQRMSRHSRLQRMANPLAVRISMGDPDAWLSRLAPRFKLLFSAKTVWVWALTMLVAAGLTVSYWSNIQHEFATRTLRLQTLWWFALLYPMMKIVHELAHAMCVKQWGGQVRDVGISILLLIPVPYVNASDVYTTHTRKQRMVLTAAGMGAELFIAAIALILWVWVAPGYTRDALFSVCVIGSISTLLFNANPLLKFDGYYLLQDALDIPNLALRSSLWLRYCFKRYVLGLTKLAIPNAAPSEKRWLSAYGVAVALYKPILTISIVIFLWRSYPWLGLLLGGFAVLFHWLLPATKGFYWLAFSRDLKQQRSRALGVVFCACCVCVTLFLVPLPANTKAHGIVSAAGQSEIYSESGGVVSAVHVSPGAVVQAGDVLLTLVNPDLHRDIQQIEAEIAGLNSMGVATLQRTKAVEVARDYASLMAEKSRLGANLAQLQKRRAGLRVTAQQNGQFAPLDDNLLPGRHIEQGERIGYVVSGSDWTIRTVIPETRAAQLRAGVEGATVRLAQAYGTRVKATLLHETPAVTRRLPSAALAQFGGGEIGTDPFDSEHVTALQNLIELELSLENDVPIVGLGQRALVQLEHPAEALLTRAWRFLSSVWLTRMQHMS